MKIKKYVAGTGWVQQYPEVDVGSIVATGTPSSSTFLRGDGTWAAPTDVDTNNYLTGVSGSGNGTITFTRQGLTNLTFNAAHTHSEYLKYNPDGDGIAISYDDSNPTINGQAVGGGHTFGADGSLTNGYLNAKVLLANGSTNSVSGYYVGAMTPSSGGSSTQVIDGSGNWVGNVIAAAKIGSHTHAISDVTNLQTTLDGKLSTSGKAADANLLDGLDSSAYLRDDGWNTSPGQDANTQPNMKADFTYSNNAPHTGSLVSFGAGNYQMQLNGTYSGQSLSFRNRNGDNGTWNTWREVIHAGNIGSQSVSYANNAGTLDSIDSSQFVRSDAADTVSGALTLTSINNTFSGHHYFSAYDADGNHYPHYNQGANNNGSKINLRVYSSGGAFQTLYIDGNSNNMTWRGHTIWNSGNDGGGSGLDADTVDGLQASSLVQTSGNQTIAGQKTFSDYGYFDAGFRVGNSTGTVSDSVTFDTAQTYTGPYIRGSGQNLQRGYYTGQYTIWDSGNDGSGSGLDADLLDGQHGSYYQNASNLNAGTIPAARIPNAGTTAVGGIKARLSGTTLYITNNGNNP